MIINLKQEEDNRKLFNAGLWALLIIVVTAICLLTNLTYDDYVKANTTNIEDETAVEVVRVDYIKVKPTQSNVLSGKVSKVSEGSINTTSVKQDTKDSVLSFLKGYRGARINETYLRAIRTNCGNEKAVKLVVAISVAETGAGRDTKNKSNFYGWFKGGNRRYDPSYDQMAKDMCGAVNGYYKDVATNKAKAKRYTGSDNTDRWVYAVNWALGKMR